MTTAQLEEATLEAITQLGDATNLPTEASVADMLELGAEDRSSRTPDDAMTVLGYRIAWSRTSLKSRGLVCNVARGVWRAGSQEVEGSTARPTVPPTVGTVAAAALFPWHRLSVRELLVADRQNLRELQRRKVIRGRGAIVGDLAEWLVATAYDGVLAPPVQRAHDVLLGDGTRLQVKARVAPQGGPAGRVQLGTIHHDEYDMLIGVLFDDDIAVREALEIPRHLVETHGRSRDGTFTLHLNGEVIDRLVADGATLVTERLQAAADAFDDPPGMPPPDSAEDEATLASTVL